MVRRTCSLILPCSVNHESSRVCLFFRGAATCWIGFDSAIYYLLLSTMGNSPRMGSIDNAYRYLTRFLHLNATRCGRLTLTGLLLLYFALDAPDDRRDDDIYMNVSPRRHPPVFMHTHFLPVLESAPTAQEWVHTCVSVVACMLNSLSAPLPRVYDGRPSRH